MSNDVHDRGVAGRLHDIQDAESLEVAKKSADEALDEYRKELDSRIEFFDGLIDDEPEIEDDDEPKIKDEDGGILSRLWGARPPVWAWYAVGVCAAFGTLATNDPATQTVLFLTTAFSAGFGSGQRVAEVSADV